MARDRRAGRGERKWWWGIGAAVLIAGFLVVMDLIQNGRVTWSLWPAAIVLVLGVGFGLLNRFGREPA